MNLCSRSEGGVDKLIHAKKTKPFLKLTLCFDGFIQDCCICTGVEIGRCKHCPFILQGLKDGADDCLVNIWFLLRGMYEEGCKIHFSNALGGLMLKQTNSPITPQQQSFSLKHAAVFVLLGNIFASFFFLL